MHRRGTINANKIEVLSATIPITGGSIAPPAIEETINPDNSFVYSGILSIVIENKSGKIFAKPRPTIKTPIRVRVNELQKISNIPLRAVTPVINNNFFGAICDIINDPKNRPTKIGR